MKKIITLLFSLLSLSSIASTNCNEAASQFNELSLILPRVTGVAPYISINVSIDACEGELAENESFDIVVHSIGLLSVLYEGNDGPNPLRSLQSSKAVSRRLFRRSKRLCRRLGRKVESISCDDIENANLRKDGIHCFSCVTSEE